MPKKNNKSAIVMSGIAILSALLTFLFWTLLRGRFEINTMGEVRSASPGETAIISFFSFVVLILFVVLPGAFFIHNWSESYFGVQGAVRWGIFGIVFGSLAQIRILIPDGTTERGFSSFLVEKGLSFVLGITFLYVSHWVAFKSFRGSNKEHKLP